MKTGPLSILSKILILEPFKNSFSNLQNANNQLVVD
jgi:hypothetical protein